MKKIISIMTLCAFLAGCAQGGTVMLMGEKPKVARPTSQVEIFLEAPKRPFKVIALVNASASTKDQLFESTAEAETNAFEQLKQQAAEAGADGIYEITQSTVDNGIVVSTSEAGQARATVSGNKIKGSEYSSGFANLFNDHEIIIKGKAIKFE
jgi:hypothetical protein